MFKSMFKSMSIEESNLPLSDLDCQLKTYVISILWIQLFANLWTLLLVLLPVVTTLPPANYYSNHNNWFGGDDVARIIEPFIGFPLYFYIFMDGYNKSKHSHIILICFGIASVLYIQGAGLHTASNMFKNALETVLETVYINENDNNCDLTNLTDLYYWMRTIWEHNISHYMYASGLAIIFVLQAYVYKTQFIINESIQKIRYLVFSTAIIRGLLIASACIEFPFGTIVGYVYLICTIFWSIYTIYTNPIHHDINWKKEFIKPESRPIWMSFTLSYMIAFTILIFWTCIFGFKSRSQVKLRPIR